MRRILFISLAAILVGAIPAAAQDRAVVELVPRATFATDTFAGSDLGNGFGIGISAAVFVHPRLAPYVGWDWRRATASASFAGPDVDVEETGYAFGLRYEHPVGTATRLILRGGGTYNHVEIENVAGDIVADSGHGFGWEAGAGVAVPMGNRWWLTPGVRVHSLDRSIVLDSISTPITLRSVAIEVGFARRF